jgi:periplasmic protein CpxP/Spy
MTRRAYPCTMQTILMVAVALCALPTRAWPSHLARVEARIKEFHTKLHITPAQEGLWQQVTAVMRDNARTLDALIEAQVTQARTTTASDDLRAYSAFADAHAEGLKALLAAFEPLYASLSATQKQQADTLVRQRIRAREKRR